MTAAADSYSQFIDQIWFDGIVVSQHDLVVMFEVMFGWEEMVAVVRVHLPDVLVGPASEDVLFGIKGVVDANIELVRQSRVSNVIDEVDCSHHENVGVAGVG